VVAGIVVELPFLTRPVLERVNLFEAAGSVIR
jgi:hypothetical protein